MMKSGKCGRKTKSPVRGRLESNQVTARSSPGIAGGRRRGRGIRLVGTLHAGPSQRTFHGGPRPHAPHLREVRHPADLCGRLPRRQPARRFGPLRDLLKDDACLIGTQLHPWVNPPFDEENLRAQLLPRQFAPRSGARQACRPDPRHRGRAWPDPAHLQGRPLRPWPWTFRTLTELGYQIDISAVPGADLRTHHGPDFRQVAPQPYWIGPAGRLLELPLTRGYVGLLSDSGRDSKER